MFWKNVLSAARRPAAGIPLSPRSWSLSARLTAWYASSAFALVLVATGFLYWILVRTFDVEDRELLADEIHILRALLRDRAEDSLELKQEIEGEWAARQYERIYIRLLDESRQPLVETPGMSKRLVPDLFPTPVGVDEEPGQGAEIHSPAGRPFWALTAWATVNPGRDHSLVIQVALDRSYEKKLLATYRRRMWLVFNLAFILCVFGGYRIARRGIRPVEEITETARRIRSSTLHERIEMAGLPAELAALAATFNDMLDRLEASFQRLSQFSADIAHELRTPVNNLRGEAEVALSKPRSLQEYCEVLGSCLEEGTRLARMIDSLLFLSRAESPETQIGREQVDIGRELALVQDFYEAAATEAGVTLTVEATEGIETRVDRTLFQRAVGNLVANALAHTSPRGTVAMAATVEDATIRVAITDTGCGIPATHLPYLFDRFYRADRARSHISGGLGLGLAIVKSIATLHGGSVDITSEVGRGTCVTLVFPRQMTNS
jgi:two-component system heavy metal sensor histidine kinase CusS